MGRKKRGSRVTIVVGICVVAVVGGGVGLGWRDLVIAHYLSRLQDETKFFASALRSDRESLERVALVQYLRTPEGRKAFLSFLLDEYERDADNDDELLGVDTAVIAILSFGSSRRFWDQSSYGTKTASGEVGTTTRSAHLDVIDELLAIVAGHTVSLAGYPGLEFRVRPFNAADFPSIRDPEITPDFAVFVSRAVP